MEDLKVLRQKVVETEKLLNEKRASLADFKKRQDEIVRQLGDKNFEFETSEMEKVNLMKQVPTGEASEKAVFSKSAEIERLQREIKDLEGLLAGFPVAKDSLTREVTQLEKNLQGAGHGFWFAVSKEEQKKVEGNKQLLRCWAAMCLGGVSQSFGDFLRHNFGSYQTSEFSRISDEIKKEYLGEGVK